MVNKVLHSSIRIAQILRTTIAITNHIGNYSNNSDDTRYDLDEEHFLDVTMYCYDFKTFRCLEILAYSQTTNKVVSSWLVDNNIYASQDYDDVHLDKENMAYENTFEELIDLEASSEIDRFVDNDFSNYVNDMFIVNIATYVVGIDILEHYVPLDALDIVLVHHILGMVEVISYQEMVVEIGDDEINTMGNVVVLDEVLTYDEPYIQIYDQVKLVP